VIFWVIGLLVCWMMFGATLSCTRLERVTSKLRTGEWSDRLADTTIWLSQKNVLYIAVREILLWPLTKIRW